jgi:G6PDH family F420-dependent oxidoreductase
LNEHITGERWPATAERQERLAEAIEVIRGLWEGDLTSYRGQYFTVENARLYSLPDEPPPLHVAVAGPRSVELAADHGDGIIGTAPRAESVEQFRREGGEGPAYGQLTVCWAEDEADARRTAHQVWPNAAIGGTLTFELPLPSHFEAAAETVREEDVAGSVVCGPDPERHRAAIQEFVDAGYENVYVHQVGEDQEGFFDFYEREVLPHLGP